MCLNSGASGQSLIYCGSLQLVIESPRLIYCGPLPLVIEAQGWSKSSDLRKWLAGLSVLEWSRGKRPERRFTGLFSGDFGPDEP